MINFRQKEIVELFCNKMDELLATKTGVYDRQDPTYFKKYRGKVWVRHAYGDFWETDEEGQEILHNGEQVPTEPPPLEVDIIINDNTWGIEFKFITDIGECQAYWSRDFAAFNPKGKNEGGEWAMVKGNFFVVFKDLLMEGSKESPYQEADDFFY